MSDKDGAGRNRLVYGIRLCGMESSGMCITRLGGVAYRIGCVSSADSLITVRRTGILDMVTGWV